MLKRFLSLSFLLFSVVSLSDAVAQSPEPSAVLRFDELQAEELPDTPRATTLPEGGAVLRVSDPDLPVICKLNRKRVPFASAYDEVTLWNVRRVRVRERRMRLSDTTRREPVRLLKFFTERGRRRGARPHLSGNVAGCVWSALYYDSVAGCWDSTRMHISGYTLRADYDSVRRAGVDLTKSPIPRELWHPLPPDTRYVLDGEEVEGSIIHMLDGLILRSLDVVEVPNAGTGGKLVVGTTYPKRVPLGIGRADGSASPNGCGCRGLVFSTCRPPCRCVFSICCQPRPCRSTVRRAVTAPSALIWFRDFSALPRVVPVCAFR